MTTTLTIIFFIFGLIVGSFLNVVIYRYNTHRSFRGRSGCMTCQNKLAWYELIPVLSFIFLGGRCKSCKSKISYQYPIVETLSGIIFACLFLKFEYVFYLDTIGFALTYAFYVIVFSLLLVIAVYDLKHKIIPDTLSLVLGILTFVGLFFFNDFGFLPHWPSWWHLFSGPLLALPFALIWILSKGKWMGLGDAKLAISLGWLLGSRMLSGVILSFWIGAVVGIFLMLFSKKHGLKSEIPFAPFLMLGTILSFLFELYLFPVF